MTTIRDDVLADHLQQFPQERERLLPFLNGFDVNWARRRRAYNTELSVYFLAPANYIKELFGFESEILLAISDYPKVQPRTMQAIDRIIQDDPARGRVDQTAFFLITEDRNIRSWVDDYSSLNPQSRIPIVFSYQELQDSNGDSWFVRSAMMKQLFSRDLFKEQLPIINDLFFFGRDQIVAEFVSAIRQSENRGLFGLRKTGKTSVLFKVKRLAEQSGALVLYYDCKSPAVRNLRWDKFLIKITDDLYGAVSAKYNRAQGDELHVTEKFREAVTRISKKKRIAIVFDEIEWISHLAILDLHWQNDFVPFWQTMWTTQSEVRALAFIIAGVNPTVIEVDNVAGVQNPIFGIVSPTYLRGFEEKEIRAMLHHFGKRMGLNFELPAVQYLYERYGGHPLLTRMACSYTNNLVLQSNIERPATVAMQLLVKSTEERESELSFYCRHIVSELKSFYRDEYHMLEMLAAGNIADFIEMSVEQEYIKHLTRYGLITHLAGAQPRIAIPVLSRFINLERMKTEKRNIELHIIPVQSRLNWLANRLRRITDDLRQLERVATAANKPKLFGQHGFPEAERFNGLSVIDSREQFESFINICNRCFVEAVERTGRSLSLQNYFWDGVKLAYPDLWAALLRIKLLRNDQFHLTLNEQVDAQLAKQIDADLMGRKPSQLAEPFFTLQQLVIDGLFVGIQVELDRLT